MSTQHVLDRIVREEIFTGANEMVQTLLNGGLCLESCSFAELHHACLSAPDYSEPPEGYTVRPSAYDGRWFFVDPDDVPEGDDYDTEREAIIAAWEDSGDEPDDTEALQFWLVSDWLADKLEDIGEPIARDVLGFNVWGRTECGQALTADASLNRVARRLTDA